VQDGIAVQDETELKGGVFIMRANGAHAQRVTDQGKRYEDFAPVWSPGGHRIAFVRFDEHRDKDAIFVVRANGTDEHRITPWWVNCVQNPDWSPNGRWLIATCHPQEQTDLWLVHPNGTKLHRLTHSAGMNVRWFSSSFSPDGTRIVTSQSPGAGLEATRNADVYVLDHDGAAIENITQSPQWDSAPHWGARR
jgi:TolB protein